MAKVVIFGTRDTAEIAHYYLERDSDHEVVGFTLTAEYLEADTFRGLPLVAFEDLEHHFPPEDFDCFAPMTAKGMNRLREGIYRQIKGKGYRCISYISSRAAVFTEHIGENCLVLENTVIQPGASIGDNVMLWSGNHIGHHSRIDNHNFLAGHVGVSGHCHLGPYCFIGGNATIRDGLTLAEGTFLAMASALTRNTEPWGVYRGNPARKMRIDSRQFYA